MSDYVASIIHSMWQGKAGRTWEETCEKFPPQADWFRKIANQLPKPVGWDRLYKLDMWSFFREVPTVNEILQGNNSKDLALWVRELLFTIYHTTNVETLTELNYKQAGMLMERDLTIRQLKEELKMKKQQEEKDIKDNIINMDEARLALAAKDPPPPGGNWLSTLKKGTRFLASKKNYPEPVLGDFFVGSDPNEMKAVYLGYDMGSKEFGFKFFDPIIFSQLYSLYDVIQTEVEANGNGNQVPNGTVAGDGEPQIIAGVHEEE